MPEEWKERNETPEEERQDFTLAPGSPIPEYEDVKTVMEGKNIIEEVASFPTPDTDRTDTLEVPENSYKAQEGILTFECGLCHAKNPIHKMRYGLFFPVAEETRLNLKCENCGIETTVFYELV